MYNPYTSLPLVTVEETIEVKPILVNDRLCYRYLIAYTDDGNMFEITIAYTLKRFTTVNRQPCLMLGASFCSKSDQFNKILGKELATNRMYSTPLTVEVQEPERGWQVTETVDQLVLLAINGILHITGMPEKLKASRCTDVKGRYQTFNTEKRRHLFTNSQS